MTDAARREHETLKKKVQPKLSLSLTGSLSRSSISTPPRHTSGNLTPPVTPPITPSSSFRSSTPTGNHSWHTHLVFSHSEIYTLSLGKQWSGVSVRKWTFQSGGSHSEQTSALAAGNMNPCQFIQCPLHHIVWRHVSRVFSGIKCPECPQASSKSHTWLTLCNWWEKHW